MVDLLGAEVDRNLPAESARGQRGPPGVAPSGWRATARIARQQVQADRDAGLPAVASADS